MKRQNNVRRNGAVLLLILGIMAMFAISILTYMVVTSNMAETAQNSAKLDAVLEIPAQEDVDQALKNVVIGSDNERNPIGPFSILENMYGDWKEYPNVNYEDASVDFLANINIFPNLGCAIVTPVETPDRNVLTGMADADARREVLALFENSGGVMTFLDPLSFPNWEAENAWASDVRNSSAFILEKVITCPTNLCYKAADPVGDYWVDHYLDTLTENESNKGNYSPCDYWHFKVELTDDLKRFASDYCGNTPSNINSFNTSKPTVYVRLNRPAYSGTGAGGFTPGEAKDASVTPEIKSAVESSYGDQADQFRIPFAFWANAAAPDLYPYKRTNSTKPSFRSYWAHLTDVNYDAHQLDVDTGQPRYAFPGSGTNPWVLNNAVTEGFRNGAYLEPVRMNPSYTAPDNRTMFLAHYDGPMTVDGPLAAITPSFHRPYLFETLIENGYISAFQGLYSAAGKSNDALQPLLATLVRKLTPRPLPYDHLNFSGGNPELDPNGSVPSVETLANRLAYSEQWDVDNDGDGVREGVWIPSGLPIRVDKNGTPYATMFSYTVLDLDGRVNINTAGNWDQIPHTPDEDQHWLRLDPYGNGTDNFIQDKYQPYNYVDELASLWDRVPAGSDFYSTPYGDAENLYLSFRWLNAANQDTKFADRGDGRGTSNVMLYEALSSIFDSYETDSVATVASNLLWRRNLAIYDDPQGVVNLSNLEREWNISSQLSSQPGYKENGAETDDENGTRQEFFRFMDPVRLTGLAGQGFSNEATATLADAKMIFPYRGKTTVNMNRNADAAVYDFANSAFRTYDPLGAQVYTYAPRYSNNPYLARQYVSAWQDSPYTLPMLERLLRPSDSDANALPTQLVDDLMMNSDLFGDTAKELERAKARQSLTTISSDVPAPALVFPDNNKIEEGEYRGGHFGFADLIRRCVRKELYKVFESKGICQKQVDGDGVEIEGTNVYLETAPNAAVFDKKVEEITAYLVSMLPPEIMAGEKIDLNALSQKNYWLDVDYTDLDDDGSLELVAAEDASGDRTMHNYGLVKRMERARGLYIVMMTLLYEDMNAKALYDDGSDDAGAGGAGGAGGADPDDVEEKLADYIEGSFDLLKFDDGDAKKAKGLMGQELTATRIAQWCVNTIDFSDPDATMTPFFFDPTPFDGWWVYNNDWIEDKANAARGFNRWEITNRYTGPDGNEYTNNGWSLSNFLPEENSATAPEISFLFSPKFGVPSEQMFDFFYDALNNSEDSLPDAHPSVYSDYLVINDTGVPIRSNAYIAKWMTKKIGKLEDQSSDLGFRLAWGMERPDLVLTETLSFHDLGIADTNKESDPDTDVPQMVKESGNPPIEDFDQVKRPVGSTYLELYCTANPNVPQSRELYEYDAAENVWKLRLSKKTPVFKDSEERELEMPVWRVAISAAADPCGWNQDENQEELKKGTRCVYNKPRNSVLDWLTPNKVDNDYVDDFSFFSLQTRQFRNLPAPNVAGGLKVDSIADLDLDQGLKDDGSIKEPVASNYFGDWKDFNISASNLLGPAVAAKEEQPRTREIEIDRIVWFNHALGDSDNSSGMNLGTAGKYPDALRTFANVKDENVYLAPNQYLVVGPADNLTPPSNPPQPAVWSFKRSIGSVPLNFSSNHRFGQAPKADWSNHWISLDNLGIPNFSGNYEYIGVASNIGSRGLNISEPLWTADKVDPYVLMTKDPENPDDPTKVAVKVIDPSLEPGGALENTSVNGVNGKKAAVLDIPFELPKEWSKGGRSDVTDNFYKNTVSNYPIVQDKLFGLGTVPAYKSAFVQRVADPNRPYHPLMNPYITVDWNVMDLTVFAGDSVEIAGAELENETSDAPFASGGEKPYPFGGEGKNNIKLVCNKALDSVPESLDEEKHTLSYTKAFSSRQWGNAEQGAFAQSLDDDEFNPRTRPNPWARAFKKEEDDKAGLQEGIHVNVSHILEINPSIGSTDSPAFQRVPQHTLGMYNNIGKWGSWQDSDGNGEKDEFVPSESGGEFKQLNSNYLSSGDVYMGAPRVPFEHLVWNDAPFSNPMELALVPASAPGRFGLEFVRNPEKLNLSDLYKVEEGKGSSLGSFGVFGFRDWYNGNNIKVRKTTAPAGGGSATTKWDEDEKIGKLKEKGGVTGPYLNFFVSSKTPGETLNLCRALDFVYIPSLYLGTKRLAGKAVSDPAPGSDVPSDKGLITDKNGNALMFSKRREPGKININTATSPAWMAVDNILNRIHENDRLYGTPYSRDSFDSLRGHESGDSLSYYPNDDEFVNDRFKPEQLDKSYFQPAQTLNLWCQLTGSKPPIPSYMTLLTSMSKENEGEEGGEIPSMTPLFDGIWESLSESSGAGNQLYQYKDPTTGEWVQTDDISSIPDGTSYKSVKHEPKVNNLFEATAEMQRLSGLTTTRSNAFAVWVTVGYFEVERCKPGVNMPNHDPDGNAIFNPTTGYNALTDPNYKWYQYYQAIYPDGYTYGKELGSDFGETKRHRGFSIIDRSIPVDYRRGNSNNWTKSVLLKHILD